MMPSLARLPRSALLSVFLLLAVLAPLAAQDAGYRVRLFWQSVPDTIEIAPALPFVNARAPHLRIGNESVARLRKPLLVKARGAALLLGDRYFAHADRFEAEGEIRLRVPGRPWGTLRGSLRIWSLEGELEVEATLQREEYVKAVLAGEAGGIRETEALRALAVAIRSYAFANADRHKAEGFHFCDTTHCQDLRLVERHASLDRAVEDTADELLWHDGAPVSAYHHADSGGRTENARAVWGHAAPEWMQGRADPYSDTPGASDVRPRGWSARLAKSEIARALRAEGIAVQDNPDMAILSRTGSGRAARIQVGNREIPASAFRFAIGRHLGWQWLKSDLYEMRNEGPFARFDGRGNGHGVGLSQRGAAEMARQGADYRRILAFYFPGTRVGVNAQGVQWQMLRTERLRFLFAQGSADSAFASLVNAELSRLEAETQYRLRREWTFRVYPSLDLFRNASGLGGDVAAAARGREIHLQPLATLRGNGSLRATVRHELSHALILDEARRPLPEWLHEAMARWLGEGHDSFGTSQLPRCAGVNGFEDLERKTAGGYEERRAASLVADSLLRLAIRQLGRQTVLGWPRTGFPGNHKDALSGLLGQACQQ